MDAGKPQKQALAIAYAVKRQAHMAHGGQVAEPEEELGPEELDEPISLNEPDLDYEMDEEPEQPEVSKESKLRSIIRRIRKARKNED